MSVEAPSSRVLLYDDPLFERHETGAHPESRYRLAAIRRRLHGDGLAARCRTMPVRPAEMEEISRVHEAGHIARIRACSREGGGRLDPDTVASPESFHVASHAVGTAIDAVNRVLREEAPRALCLVRPPGHHALSSRAMGFCLFGNIAAAAAHARAVHGLNRVLIVDWDVHHGNGTQEMFYGDGAVHFLSVHRHPFYPGSGAADETGTGDGLGATWNLPLPFGTPRRDYLSGLGTLLETAAARCRPELVLISAGFDAHRADPVGSLGLESEDFSELTRMVCDVARQYAGGRLVSLLEGGYNEERLAESVAVHLETLLDYDNPAK